MMNMYETINKELPNHEWKGQCYVTGVKQLLFKGKGLI